MRLSLRIPSSSRSPVFWVRVCQRVGILTRTIWGFTKDCYSWQIPYPHLAQRRPCRQDHRSQVDDQIPVEESAVHGCCSWQRGHDGGRADIEHHVGHQLFGQFVEEGVAKRREFDDQGINVAA